METRPLDRFTLSASDRFPIAVWRWLPSGPPRAIVQISHGLAEHAARYRDFAGALSARGFAVYAHDHRGHGESIDSAAPRGHFADEGGWQKVLGDLHAVIGHARESHPGLPVFLFGHSMGSFVSRAYLLEHGDELAGVILSATGWRIGVGNKLLRMVARREVRKRGGRAPSATMTKLVFGSFNVQFFPTRTGSDWLSRDPAAVAAYIRDPMCGFDATGRLWDDFFGGIEALEAGEDDASRVPRRVPLLLIAGSRDPVSMGGVANRQLEDRYRRAGHRDVTVRRYAGGRHELVNETNRDEVVGDVLGWMDDRAATTAPPLSPSNATTSPR